MTNGQAIEIMEFRRDMAEVGSELRTAINKAIKALKITGDLENLLEAFYSDECEMCQMSNEEFVSAVEEIMQHGR